MGEVYRATDERLARDVALKVIRQDKAASELDRQRLQQEAKAIAKLQHANICSLFDIGEYEGAPYLVMELLEGKTLAEHLKGGPLSFTEVSRTGAEIASGLDAAHRAGIIHRDLKPANIFLTKSGAKLLDFGLVQLAPAQQLGQLSPGAASEETRTAAITGEGLIVGTVAYMAPEQLRNGRVDARTDIFALGLILYEMLSGRRPFHGASVADLMANILHGTPQALEELRPGIDAQLARLVNRCLDKDPEERWQNARDIARELQWLGIKSGSGNAGSSGGIRLDTQMPRRRFAGNFAAGIGFGAVAGGGVGWLASSLKQPSKPSRVVTVPVRLPRGFPPIQAGPYVSPDGESVLFHAGNNGSQVDLYRYEVKTAAVRQLTQGVSHSGPCVFSPKSNAIAYQAENKLFRLDFATNATIQLADNIAAAPASWSTDGFVVFLGKNGNVLRVPELGGAPEELWPPDQSFLFADALPGATKFALIRYLGKGSYRTTLAEPGNRTEQEVHLGSSPAFYCRLGYWISAVGTALGSTLQARKSSRHFLPVGPWRPFVTNAQISTRANADFSAEGLFAYFPIASVQRAVLAWVDRSGRLLEKLSEPGIFSTPRLSPDAKKLAVAIGAPGRDRNVWVYDFERRLRNNITDHFSDNAVPLWTNDGRQIVYSSNREDNRSLYRLSATLGGAAEKLPLLAAPGLTPQSLSPDGKWLGVSHNANGYLFHLEDNQRLQHPLLEGIFDIRFSPQGNWLAFCKGAENQRVLYIARFPQLDEQFQVSAPGATLPYWRADSREIFYSEGASVYSVAVDLSRGQPKLGAPEKLFERQMVRGQYRNSFDVTPDGQRFLVFLPVEDQQGDLSLQLILNWHLIFEEAEKSAGNS
jgi:serine/threonine-protein kinase